VRGVSAEGGDDVYKLLQKDESLTIKKIRWHKDLINSNIKIRDPDYTLKITKENKFTMKMVN